MVKGFFLYQSMRVKILYAAYCAQVRLKIFGSRVEDEFQKLGARVETLVLRKPIFFQVAAILLVSLLGFWYLHSKMSSESFSKPLLPKELDQERSSYSYSNYVPITKLDLTEKSRCITPGDLASRVKRNIHPVTFLEIRPEGELQEICNIVGLGGDVFMCNNHAIPQNATQLIYNDVQRGGLGTKVHFAFDTRCVHRCPEKDLAFFRLKGVGNRTDLLEFLPTTELSGFFNGLYGSMQGGELTFTGVKNLFKTTSRSDKVQHNISVFQTNDAVSTRAGDCGSPVIFHTSNSGAVFGGIHAFRVSDMFGRQCAASCVALSRDFIDPIVEKLRGMEPVSVREPRLSSESISRTVVALHPKSVFRYIPQGAVDVYGSLTGFRASPKSNVVDTPLRSEWEPYGVTTTFTQPEMSGWKPWRIAALDLVQPVTGFDGQILHNCVNGFLKDLRSKLKDEHLSMLHRVPEDVAVNGMPGVTYVDSINRGTSMGSPFNTPKRKFLGALDSELFQDGVVFTDEVRRRMADIRDAYGKRELWRPVFTAHLKDEPVSAAKAQLGKTRVFCGAPIDWTIVVREFFLGHIRLIMNAKFDFECAVGVVAQSKEWSSAYEHVTKFGAGRIVAGDYKSFDKKMAPALVLSAFEILIELAKDSGNFTSDDIGAMWCIAHDTAYPLVDYHGDLVQFWGSNPSGHPLTTIINSLANSLYVRYAYVLAGGDVEQFSQHVSLLTYGDDNIMSVSKKCSFFDHTVLQKQLASIGVVYTMADKESASVPFIHIADASFLKRQWVFDRAHGVYMAPLDINSIHKMLCITVLSKSVTTEEQMYSIIRSALMEAFFHGEDFFDKYRDMFLHVLSKHVEYQSFLASSPLLTYEAFWDLFAKNSEGLKSSF
jgi:hypothetical protein